MLKFRRYLTVATTVAVFLGSFGHYWSVESLEHMFHIAKQHLSNHILRSLQIKENPVQFLIQDRVLWFILQSNRTRKTEKMNSKQEVPELECHVSQPVLNN